jgi:hypothetical protein
VIETCEESGSYDLLPGQFHCKPPAERLAQAQATAVILGEAI